MEIDVTQHYPHEAAKVVITPLNRINLRLSSETFRNIDAARSKRAGNVSRNTWIAEAIEEKIARESMELVVELKERAANG